MHDEVAVRVLHGFAHVAKEPHAPDHRRRVRAAILGERRALDVLHHEPRRAIGERARVVQAGDERMVQLGKRPLLADESLAPRRREPRVAQNLHGGDRAQVVALGVVHDAHTTLAEDPRDAVGPEECVGEWEDVIAASSQHRVGRRRDASVQQRIAPRVLGEQRQRIVDE